MFRLLVFVAGMMIGYLVLPDLSSVALNCTSQEQYQNVPYDGNPCAYRELDRKADAIIRQEQAEREAKVRATVKLWLPFLLTIVGLWLYVTFLATGSLLLRENHRKVKRRHD